MTSDLHWRIVPPPVPDNDLSSELKYKLRDRLWGGDEPRNEAFLITSDNSSVIGYLDGLIACGVEDADRLRHLVMTNGKIEVWVGDPNGPR